MSVAPLMDRFVDRVMLMPDGCWQWTGSLVQKGYGQLKSDGRGLRAHRVSYEYFVDPIPEGLYLHHECGNRGCVNPAHLRPVTNGENILLGNNRAAQNARKTHCDRGHEFTEENTYHYPGRNKRCCLTCREFYRLSHVKPAIASEPTASAASTP